MPRTSHIAIAAVIAACAAVGPQAASAATVDKSVNPGSPDYLWFTASPGEANKVSVSVQGDRIKFRDTGAPVVENGNCTQDAADVVSCPSSDVDNIYVFAGDKANTVYADTPIPIYIDGMEGTSNHLTAYGSSGNYLRGGAGQDVLASGNGQDELVGNAGPDTLQAGGGKDTLKGGPGGDRLLPGSGQDEIEGGADWDHVSYEERVTPITISLNDVADDGWAGEGDNVRTDVEEIRSGYGPDLLRGTNGSNVIRANGGEDTIYGYGDADLISAGSENDKVYGGDGNDQLLGGEGDDMVDGGAGDDGVSGDQGNDDLRGGTHNDQLDGWIGDDTLSGGDGDDKVDGGPDRDLLVADLGADKLNGGADPDTVDYSAYTGPITVDLDGSAYDDGLESEGDSVGADVEGILGGSEGDRLTGNAEPNVIHGNGGADTIDGGLGLDQLFGEAGTDSIRSNDGQADSVDCGPDADSFDADGSDTLAGCEPKPEPATPAGPKPKVKIGPATVKVAKGVAKLRLTCPATAKSACTGALSLRRTINETTRTIGKRSFRVAPGANRTVKVTLTKSARTSVSKAKAGGFKVTAVAAAGPKSGGATARRVVRLER
ncbi:MAG TPA: calcium-binding protein [Thermoleophilaceae bacterium]|nr:calcium-binding protein [Thermoleophilaceae bacterium]